MTASKKAPAPLTPLTVDEIRALATAEVASEKAAELAEIRKRKDWWATTLGLATVPSREKKLVGVAQAAVREITGQSTTYVQQRTRTGRNFAMLEHGETVVLPPKMAIELINRGSLKPTPEFIDLMREIDADPDRGVRDFIAALPAPQPKPEPKPAPKSKDVVPDHVPDDIMDAPAPAPADTPAGTTPKSGAEPLPTFYAVGGTVVTPPTSEEWDEKIAAAKAYDHEAHGGEKFSFAYREWSNKFHPLRADVEMLSDDQRAVAARLINHLIDVDIEWLQMLKRRLTGGPLEDPGIIAGIEAKKLADELNDMAKKGGDVDWDKEAAKMTSE